MLPGTKLLVMQALSAESASAHAAAMAEAAAAAAAVAIESGHVTSASL